MNVFILSHDIAESASMLDDAHLIAQISEATQILMANWNDGRSESYAVIGHLHHPVTKYYAGIKQTEELLSYLFELLTEYYIRFGKEHQNFFWAIGFAHDNPQYFHNFSNFSKSKTFVHDHMTDDIEEIRKYIMTKPHKRPLKWTNRKKPDWWEV